MWKSPFDDDAVEKAYAKNQVTKVMAFDEFVQHIADHNGVFTRGTVKGVVSDTCSCLVEMLLNGYKVQFGELGTFGISIICEPAKSLEAFTAKNIKEVNILFTPGEDFENLVGRAEFVPVASRVAQAAVYKAEKSGGGIVDLDALKEKKSDATDPADKTGSEDGPENPGNEDGTGEDGPTEGGGTGGDGDEFV